LSTGLVAKSQQRFGRKGSFLLGLLIALISAGIGAWAVLHSSFILLVVATLVAGYYSANGQLYRFAAAELCAPDYREKAVSLVMAGGLMGAIIGPNLAKYTKNWLELPFAGAYVALSVIALLSMALMACIEFPPVAAKKSSDQTGRSLHEIARQPVFIVATLSAALGYGVMNLLMAATPLAMQVCGLSFEDTAWVLQWHVIGMFAPGFVTGNLIKDKAQAAINFCVFATMAVTSFASGALVTTQGWTWLNWGSLLPVAITASGLVFLKLRPNRVQG
jgi:predicted MFS family arabinose efflux permease